ncbi:hypothetical protein AB1Y20_019208 [Prymnesium parvum]|uniref:Uncharacterized protein n=1 Tax=Prymnesium parvum TaxID=97485 RepID=A0AB34JTM3_PRYPA|mmetsp:Transcript_23516/g.53789  ORF Transcript_23516/g.53789 Transcript_23516/m.53789 type:complete len:212 (+) Transcript_23516:2-637(+)
MATTSTRKVKKPGFLGCCCGSIEDVALEVQMTAAAFKAPPPLTLEHGYANEEGAARGMAPPRSGCFEVVNKNKEGEIIAILVAANAAELALKGRDVHGHVARYVRLMPDCTVLNASFTEEVEFLEIALFYGARYKTIERCRTGTAHDNFEFVKVYRVNCKGKNVMVKYKKGELELQKGTPESMLSAKRRSLGGGVDMATNVSVLEQVKLVQ